MHLPDDMKIMYIYRYISLLVTSLFYLFDNKSSSFTMKLFMIVCLTISSIIFNYLYGVAEHVGKILIIFIIIEVIGNILVLVPTGGIDSPYIWYSLNSIFITVYFYNIYISFLVLLIYQIFSSFLSELIFHSSKLSLFQLLAHNSNLLLSFTLIIITVQLLLIQAKKLNIKSKDLCILNNQLTISNVRLKNSMEQIMCLYQAVYSFTNLDNKDKLINLIIEYAKEITKSPLIMLCTLSENETWCIKMNEEAPISTQNLAIQSIKDKWDEVKHTDIPIILTVSSTRFMIIPVNSSIRFYGVLGIEVVQYETDELYKETVDQMRFLASLSSIALEKFALEPLKRQLLINEEQNRIANEIHDSVSQRLFAISCGIFGIIRKTKNTVSNEVTSELNEIKDSINTTIKELRETIYSMSWNKQGVSIFQVNIKKYINDISKLYGINISLNIDGSEELISSVLKRALYRIICEGVGNSARHGKSKYIKVALNIDRNIIKLTITDDGTGFEMNNSKENLGLGIKNINNLIYSLEGKMEVNTALGQGTVINISLPNSITNKGEKVIV
jgi:two-component system, NarL family, sensor histidine kinase LiaS